MLKLWLQGQSSAKVLPMRAASDTTICNSSWCCQGSPSPPWWYLWRSSCALGYGRSISSIKPSTNQSYCNRSHLNRSHYHTSYKSPICSLNPSTNHSSNSWWCTIWGHCSHWSPRIAANQRLRVTETATNGGGRCYWRRNLISALTNNHTRCSPNHL